MTTPAHQQIHTAADAVAHEIEIIEAERAAFRRFVRRLDTIEPVEPTPVSPGPATGGCLRAAGVESAAATGGLQRARTAYRETVMATPHYDEEYGESLETNVTAEFGPTLATQLSDGAALTPVLWQSLRDATEDAIGDRSMFLTALKFEHRSLTDCGESIDGIQRTLNEIHSSLQGAHETASVDALDERLATLEAECETLATRRQEQIHDRPGTLPSDADDASLARYLYDDVDSVCPVLRAVTQCLDTIHNCRRRCRQ